MGDKMPAPHLHKDITDLISWYHPRATRHVANSLLLTNASEGTYLLRPCESTDGDLTLSLKCKTAVKHFPIAWTGKEYKFGLGTFPSLEEFIGHFSNQPMIAGENGVLTVLRYPYPREVDDVGLYDAVKIHAQLGPPSANPENIQNFSASTHEGFLTKQGGRVKNWKTRWFVLKQTELRYYRERTSGEPIRVLDLRNCIGVETEHDMGKENCFRTVFNERTFYMYGSSKKEVAEWIEKLKWTLDQLKKSKAKQES